MSEQPEQIANGLLVFPNTHDNFGFIRLSQNSYAASQDDIFVNPTLVNSFRLRPADRIIGHWGPPRGNHHHRSLIDIISVNDKPPGQQDRPFFDDLTPIYPNRPIKLEHNPAELTSRVIDLVAPLGFGQRSCIVAAPRAGKTVILHRIATAIQTNHPKATLIALLIDERPEEVTDFKEVVKGQVIASTFDEQPERHVEVAEVVIERAKRLAEQKGDVIILLDSITRLARAYNTVTPPSGRVMSGGLDARALPAPKKIFGAARCLREGGSITIIATTLVDTGSKMDEVIFEEFKGTGNSELHLDRRLMDKRIFPCIDILKSGTRKEELLLDKDLKDKWWAIRQTLAPAGGVAGMEVLKSNLMKTKSNAEFLAMAGK